MTSRYRHRRTFDPAIAFPSPVEPGEIIVNTSNRQIAVGDANAAQLGVPKALIGVRFFDTTARYALNDVVVQAGNLYKANATIPPGAFNGANWTQLGVVTTMPAGSVVFTPTGNVIAIDVQSAIAEVDAEKVAKAGDVMSGHLSLPASPSAPNAVRKDYVDAADAALATLAGGKVDKGGDTMTGALVLPADPTVPLHAATKQYVDANTGSALVVSDTPPAGAKDGALWWESDSGLLYVRYNDGNTTQWVIAAPQPDINAFALANTVVRYDTAQSLTAPQQQQARQNIYAAPFDAMAYSGLQINGAMEVSQELGSTGTQTNGKYICDGWKLSTSGSMVLGAAQGFTANLFPGMSYFLGVNVLTAEASIAPADFAAITQPIEGWRIARLGWGTPAAQPITIGFWTFHHRPGLYSVVARGPSPNRTYVATYTHAAADAKQYNTITIPGDTTGTWPNDNSIGLAITFALSAGTGWTAPAANTWYSVNYVGAPGQVNAVAATSDVFIISGVIVLPGSEAPSAARSPFVMRSYDQELVTCRRYWQAVTFSLESQTALAGVVISSPINLAPVMRSAPTVATSSNFASNVSTAPTITSTTNTPYGMSMQTQSVAAGRAYWYGQINCDARL